MGDRLDPVLKAIEDDRDGALDRLKDLLRIPSISTDPEYAANTREAAAWCAAQLDGIGFDASVRETPKHPMVVAHDHGAGDDAPHFLYYGHYDVQPPDPLEQWESPPFEPVIVDDERGGRIVARGAVDDKGQLMTFVEAFRAWRAVHGSLPVRVTVLLEGEEECGSPSLDGFLREHRDELVADACVVCDTGMWDIDTPAVTTMLRGLVYVDITLHGPSHDLHSGMYGGAVVNPINALVRVLGQLHDDEGRVQLPGFYDQVRELSDEERAAWDGLGFDADAFIRHAGLERSTGEAGRSVLERIWSRPTCDLNGIWGGYTNAGAKTVIAARASAKLSCRLVADQDPAAVYQSVVDFLEARTPEGCRWEIASHGVNPAVRVPTDSPYLEATRTALETVYGREAVLIGSGGSIPVVESITRLLGVDSLLVGFGLDDDRIHSPNEKFQLRCFEQGVRSHAAMLETFAAVGRTAAAT